MDYNEFQNTLFSMFFLKCIYKTIFKWTDYTAWLQVTNKRKDVTPHLTFSKTMLTVWMTWTQYSSHSYTVFDWLAQWKSKWWSPLWLQFLDLSKVVLILLSLAHQKSPFRFQNLIWLVCLSHYFGIKGCQLGLHNFLHLSCGTYTVPTFYTTTSKLFITYCLFSLNKFVVFYSLFPGISQVQILLG